MGTSPHGDLDPIHSREIDPSPKGLIDVNSTSGFISDHASTFAREQ